jgi:hypothetical protein
MNKYKVGDKVKVTKNNCRFSVPENSMVGKFGVIQFIDEDELYPYEVRTNNAVGWFEDDELEPLTKTLDNLEVGDMLVDEDGEERQVIGVCGKAIFISMHGCFNEALNIIYSPEKLKNEGYTFKSSDNKKQELLTKAETLEQQAKQIREDAEKL